MKDLIDYPMFHEMVMESIATGIVTIDLEGRVLTINKAAEDIFDVTREEAIGNLFLNGLAQSEWGRLGRTIRYVIETEKVFCGKEITTVNGKGRTIHINTYVSLFRNGEGRKMGVVMVTEDITHRKALEEEVRRADRLAAMGEIALGVAHEFRNPLGSIRGLASLIQSDISPDSKHARYLELIIREVDRLERVSTELLDFARRQDLECVPIDVNELLRQVVFLCELNSSMYGITIHTQFADNVPAINGDPQRLRQAFLNVLRNAVQAVGEQGSVRVETEREGNWAVIRVSDSGVGIPKNDLHRIFDPFYSTKKSGSGLGLSVVHQIITGHGGRILVESELGAGTTFIIKLPIERRNQR